MADRQDRGTATVPQQLTYTIERRARHWEVRDPAGELVCLTVYKRGAQEVIRRMLPLGPPDWTDDRSIVSRRRGERTERTPDKRAL